MLAPERIFVSSWQLDIVPGVHVRGVQRKECYTVGHLFSDGFTEWTLNIRACHNFITPCHVTSALEH
jgi:hypothetical protein